MVLEAANVYAVIPGPWRVPVTDSECEKHNSRLTL